MLKKYDELTEEQKSMVHLMYSDKDTVQMYLYNFEGDKYRGRQYNPPEGETKDGIHFGRLHIEVEPKEEKEEDKDKLPEKMIDTEPVKKVSRKSKKK